MTISANQQSEIPAAPCSIRLSQASLGFIAVTLVLAALTGYFTSKNIRRGQEFPADGGVSLRDMERKVIRSTLAKTGNNRSRTAKILDVARQTLLNKIKEYGL